MIRLSRKMRVESYDAMLTVGKVHEERSDILAFLTLIEESGGSIDAGTTNTDFFMQKFESHPFGIRWLVAMYAYQIIEPIRRTRGRELDFKSDFFTLTPQGKMILESKVVTIPMTGSYTIHATDDPLVQQSNILAIEEIRGSGLVSEWREAENMATWGKAKQSPPQAVPEFLSPYMGGGVVVLPAQNMTKMAILNIEGRVFRSKNTLNIEIELDFKNDGDFPSLTIKPSRYNSVQMDCPIRLSYEDMFSMLVKKAGLRLADDGSLLVRFEDLNPSELMSFRRKIPGVKIDIPGYGEFEANAFSEVEIKPGELSDARKWATFLTDRFVNNEANYMTREAFDSMRRGAAQKFSKWFDVERVLEGVPTYDSLIESMSKINGKSPKYWHLMAVRDLGGDL